MYVSKHFAKVRHIILTVVETEANRDEMTCLVSQDYPKLSTTFLGSHLTRNPPNFPVKPSHRTIRPDIQNTKNICNMLLIKMGERRVLQYEGT